MKRILILAAVVIVLGAGAILVAQGFLGGFIGKGDLAGVNEVPAISTIGNGSFKAEPSVYGNSVNWELTVLNLEGSITQAHIHIGQEDVNGGIAVFLCTNLGNGPAGTQPCPAPPFTIRGTFGPGQVVGGASAQGIAPGEFSEVIRMMRAGRTYANVHSNTFPGGEIRTQIIRGGGGGEQSQFRSSEPVHSGQH